MRLPIDRLPLRWLAAVLLSTALGSGASADVPSFTSAGDRSAGGAEIYSHICQGCHMPGAQGAIGAGHYPKLAGNSALVSWQYVALTVLHGRKGMPAFGLPKGEVVDFLAVQLSDAEVADVVNYVRSNFGNHYKGSITAKQVAALPHPGAAAGSDSIPDHR